MSAVKGWAWLSNSRKKHYFRAGRSLCNAWALLGLNYYGDAPADQTQECKRCRKALEQENAS